MHNGALTRKDGALWNATQFIAPDPWAEITEPAEPSDPTPQELAAQIAAINAGMH
jgi:hypothetical protein